VRSGRTARLLSRHACGHAGSIGSQVGPVRSLSGPVSRRMVGCRVSTGASMRLRVRIHCFIHSLHLASQSYDLLLQVCHLPLMVR